MASPAELARQRQDRRIALAKTAADAAATAWGLVDPGNIAGSWAYRMPEAYAATAGAQLLAADGADGYVDDVLAEEGAAYGSAGVVNPRAFSGVASDGRALSGLLYNPAIQALQAIGSGVSIQDALSLGLVALDMMVRTQVADAGRAADGAAVAARGCGYTRQLTPPSCSRCAVLAGKFYRWNAGFQRHPRCDCVHVPCTPGFSKNLKVSPRAYFDSLTEREQRRVFTVAGAQAIRDGSDIGQVVNARRGMQTAGGRVTTTESTTRRGVARRGRLMPEQIYKDAKSRDEALRMLREHGYLVGAPTPVAVAPKVHIAPLAKSSPAPMPHAGLAGHAATGVADRRQLGGGVMADTQLVRFSDGTQAVYKLAKDSSGIPAVHQQDAEELGALVARATGVQAPEVLRLSRTEIYMTHLEGRIADELEDAAVVALRAGDEGLRLGLSDLLMGNTDRNGGNLLVHDGRIAAIDHGSAFQWHREYNNPTSPPHFRDDWWSRFGTSGTSWRSNPLSKVDVETLRERLTALRPEFERLRRVGWYNSMMTRLRALERHATGVGRLIT